MGFMGKVKQFFGIGGVKVTLQCDSEGSKGGGTVNGTITLTSKSDLEVINVKVALKEEFTTGRGDSKETEEFDLGELLVSEAFNIKAGEEKAIPFQLPYEMLKSNADQLKEKGGALGALGSMAKFANAEKSEYFVVADCDVKGTAMDPSDKRSIQLL